MAGNARSVKALKQQLYHFDFGKAHVSRTEDRDAILQCIGEVWHERVGHSLTGTTTEEEGIVAFEKYVKNNLFSEIESAVTSQSYLLAAFSYSAFFLTLLDHLPYNPLSNLGMLAFTTVLFPLSELV